MWKKTKNPNFVKRNCGGNGDCLFESLAYVLNDAIRSGNYILPDGIPEISSEILRFIAISGNNYNVKRIIEDWAVVEIKNLPEYKKMEKIEKILFVEEMLKLWHKGIFKLQKGIIFTNKYYVMLMNYMMYENIDPELQKTMFKWIIVTPGIFLKNKCNYNLSPFYGDEIILKMLQQVLKFNVIIINNRNVDEYIKYCNCVTVMLHYKPRHWMAGGIVLPSSNIVITNFLV
ncbi:MAG: hypothetical protein DRM99_05170 [Thermoplasmata archaeon]|nr:MAG: hypothetical protein DRM99_05170 [Thermoplasmata archaeon]